MKQILHSKSGQSVLLLAVSVSLLVIVIMTSLQLLNDNQMRTFSRTKLLLNGLQVMQGFGVIVQRAYDLWQRDGGCTGGTTMVQPQGSAVGFCMPNNTPNGLICLNGYCLNGNYTTSNEKNNVTFEARLTSPEPNKLYVYINKFYDFFNSDAYAQRVVQRPVTPAAGSTNNSLPPIACPGGFPCRTCDGTHMQCITLQVCPLNTGICNPSQLWVQRYGIRFD